VREPIPTPSSALAFESPVEPPRRLFVTNNGRHRADHAGRSARRFIAITCRSNAAHNRARAAPEKLPPIRPGETMHRAQPGVGQSQSAEQTRHRHVFTRGLSCPLLNATRNDRAARRSPSTHNPSVIGLRDCRRTAQ